MGCSGSVWMDVIFLQNTLDSIVLNCVFSFDYIFLIAVRSIAYGHVDLIPYIGVQSHVLSSGAMTRM